MPERTSFFEEQARYRRATWRWTAAAAAAVAFMGIPLSLVLTPVVFLILLLSTIALDAVVTLPDGVGAAFEWLAATAPRLASAYEQGTGAFIRAAWLPAIAMIGPGAAALILLWLGVRARIRRDGDARLLQSLDAREPDPSSLEERQLQNVIEEMAIAAGMPVPAARIADDRSPNVAVLGRDPQDAILVVSRRVLEVCDRAETQGLLAGALAFIAHGDLAIAERIESVERTRQALSAIDLTRHGRRDGRTGLRDALLLPFHFVNLALVVTTGVMQAAVAPLFAMLWRTRRYLADASAVQLTRSPDDVARGIARVTAESADDWTDAGLRTLAGGQAPPPAKRLERLARQGAATGARPPRAWRTPGALEIAGAVVLIPLLALMAYLMAIAVGIATALAVGAMSLLLFVIHALLT